ncbi:putative ABC transporter ATPase and permease protein [Actinoplanes missouriensis 431]|uniref:Putative ABC transporter ATPase and permease protein n=1 Tax=Actinoplanes missouriensis (strain ATCC 14538 / DSM 43046 / CBS 188.64 / JCM 3121 / NBRC 102363 / NCIMB 12654 / NRRL B-3342 / UNCC 431) TaxID=512565 RepID=I0H6X9_ACTM4|nr:ABC transporter ATP-binding protein [Actinoplanes missouriensis]BAL88766.1 putative ABC transporter ATPase and permease protein [Actinoplanes missouriensis 431]
MTAQLLPVAGARESRAWLAAELRSRAGSAAFTLVAGLLAAGAAIVPAYALGLLVDRIRAGGDAAAILPPAVAIVAAAVVGGAATGVSGYLISRLGSRILADLRERTVETALRLPALVLDRAGRGDLLARVSADITAIEKAVSDVLPGMISALLLAALSLAAMLGIDWRLGLAGAVAVPLYVVALRWYLPRAAPSYAAERVAIAARSQLFVEGMQGIRTVHTYHLEDRHLAGIEDASARARDISVRVFALYTRFVGRINRAELAGLASVLVVGFLLVRHGAGTVGEVSAAALLFHRLFNPVIILMVTFDKAQDAGASLARLVGVLGMDTERRDAGQRDGGTPPDGRELVLEDVTFGYDGGDPVLRGVSLTVRPGELVALVGATGAGKTTAASIAAGILRPAEGAATVGGVPVSGLPARTIAIVSQETHVFTGTLADDLRLARPEASADEVAAALDRVGALAWASQLPDGLDTVVGDGGHQLTAAQAQQLALARVVLLDPRVVVLDEATAEAGSAGARDLEQAAAAALEGRTALVVAHRLTQAAAADRVIVMDRGAIVENGTHDDLVTAGGRYAQLWAAWSARGSAA